MQPLAAVRILTTLFLLDGLVEAAELDLQGTGSTIFMNGATVTAACASGLPAPSLAEVWPPEMTHADVQGGATVWARLGGPVPSCRSVRHMSTPCASSANAYPPAPRLFWCRWSGAGGSAATGPLAANLTEDTEAEGGGRYAAVDCPLPSYTTMITLAPYSGDGASFSLELSLLHYPQLHDGELPSHVMQDAAHVLEFTGLPNASTILFHGFPTPATPPSPLAPPSPPVPPSAPPARPPFLVATTAQVRLLLKCEGSYDDSSMSTHGVSKSGYVNTPNDDKLFGSRSCHFHGSDGYLCVSKWQLGQGRGPVPMPAPTPTPLVCTCMLTPMAIPMPVPMPRYAGDNMDWDMEHHDFTVELFLKPHNFKDWSQLFGQHTGGGNGNSRLVYYMNQHGALAFYSYDGDGNGNDYHVSTIDANGDPKQVLTLEAWNHVAFVRSGNNFRWYVNGSLVFEDPANFPTSLTDNGNSLYIGYGRTSGGSAVYLDAKVDNLRVSKGAQSALYPTEFPNFVDNRELWIDSQ